MGTYGRASVAVNNPNLRRWYGDKDLRINDGTEFLFDFHKTGSKRSLIDLQNPANGTQIINLAEGKPNGSIQVTNQGVTYRDLALSFDGSAGNLIKLGNTSNDFVLANLDDKAHPGQKNPDVIYEIWHKRETNIGYGGNAVLLGRGQSVPSHGNFEVRVHLQQNAVGLQITFDGVSAASIAIPSGAEQEQLQNLIGTWVQICAALEDGSVKLYVNGIQKASSTATFQKPYTTVNLPLVSGAGLGGVPFKGLIKSLAMHRLGFGKTASQIAAHGFTLMNTRFNP